MTKAIILFDPIDMVFSLVAGFYCFALAYLTLFYLHDESDPYPAFGLAKDLKINWMGPIIARNLIGTVVICGFWDWFLYFSPLSVSHLFNLKKALGLEI